MQGAAGDGDLMGLDRGCKIFFVWIDDDAPVKAMSRTRCFRCFLQCRPRRPVGRRLGNDMPSSDPLNIVKSIPTLLPSLLHCGEVHVFTKKLFTSSRPSKNETDKAPEKRYHGHSSAHAFPRAHTSSRLFKALVACIPTSL